MKYALISVCNDSPMICFCMVINFPPYLLLNNVIMGQSNSPISYLHTGKFVFTSYVTTIDPVISKALYHLSKNYSFTNQFHISLLPGGLNDVISMLLQYILQSF